MASNKVKVKDTGYTKYKKALEQLNSNEIRVGLFSKAGEKVLTKALVNEFGTSRAGKNGNITIPARSFIRSTYNEQVETVVKRFKQIMQAIQKGNYSVRPKLKLIGLEVQAAMQEKIITLKDPPNAPSTIAKKGSSNPLIDTGEMKNAISSQVKKIK